jgi:hypothetical protein
MTIEITRPETEALIERHLRSGRFQDIDELLKESAKARGNAGDAYSFAKPIVCASHRRVESFSLRALAIYRSSRN